MSSLWFTKGMTAPLLRHRRSLASIGERQWRRRVAVIPLVNQSEFIPLISCRSRAETRLVYTMFYKHAPCDAGQLVS